MILIGLGANLPHPRFGSPRAVLEAALQRLEALGVDLVRRSRWWRSAPVPPSDQPWFVNGVAELRVPPGVGACELLALLNQVEAEFGRRRAVRNEARVLDLDLLDFDGERRSEGSPLLPHPRLRERAFVLRPLAEVAPEWRHPDTGESVQQLIAGLPPDQSAEPLE